MKRYEGTIGPNLGVTLILSMQDGDKNNPSYSGSYHYHKTGIPIYLQHTSSRDGKAQLHETASREGDESKTFTGQWSINIGEDTVTGTWSTMDGQRKMPISLKESYPEGSVSMWPTHFTSSHSLKSQRWEARCEVRYIQFGESDQGMELINRRLRQKTWHSCLSGLDRPEDFSEEDIIEAVVASAQNSLENRGGEKGATQCVLMNENGLISIGHHEVEFGSRGIGRTGAFYASYDSETGEELTFEDVVLPGFESRWTELAQENFLTQKKASRRDFPNWELRFQDQDWLEASWILLPGGIGFLKKDQEWEGTLDLVLGWKDILPDLRPGTRIYELAEQRAR